MLYHQPIRNAFDDVKSVDHAKPHRTHADNGQFFYVRIAICENSCHVFGLLTL